MPQQANQKAVFPAMDGVASTGSSSERARLDHVHPSDTSKADKTELPTKLSDLQNDMTAEDIGALPSDTKYAASPTIGGAAKSTAGIPFAQVDAGSTSTVYTASCPEITEYKDGVCVMLMNGRVTSASGFTVNVNGLGAKPVYSTLAAASRATTLFNINYTLLLVYNSKRVEGGCWDAYYGYDSNTNTIGYQLRTNSTSMQTTDKFYRYRLLFISADNQHYVPVNTSNSTNATAARTVTQRPINPFGAIIYYGHTTAINANAYPTSTYMWTQYNFEMGYSFGALTLTQSHPVYIKCAPQSDGSAIIDSTTPYVQSLPNAADGKIYIYLGIATSATTVELFVNHPVYCYRNGGIQLWTGVQAEIDANSPLIISYDTTTQVFDSTYQTILAAHDVGREIKCEIDSGQSIFWARLTRYHGSTNPGERYFAFDYITYQYQDSEMWWGHLEINDLDTVTYDEGTITVP